MIPMVWLPFLCFSFFFLLGVAVLIFARVAGWIEEECAEEKKERHPGEECRPEYKA